MYYPKFLQLEIPIKEKTYFKTVKCMKNKNDEKNRPIGQNRYDIKITY